MNGNGGWYTGAVEAVYECSGSRANPGSRIEQSPKNAVTRGVWGHAPPGNFNILDALGSILVHFGTLFQHGKARIQTQELLLHIMLR